MQLTLQRVAICGYATSSFTGIWSLRFTPLPGTAAHPQLQVNSTKLVWMGPENYITASVMSLILDIVLSSKVFFEAEVYYRVPIQRRYKYNKKYVR